MKKRTISIVAVSLAMAVASISLTGCGTKAKATDQEVEDEETIIVTEDEETVINTEEGTETEVVEEETTKEVEGNEDVTYTEHEYFFALDQLDFSMEEEVDMNALKPDGNDFDLKESINLYGSGRAVIIGYSKPNINVHVVTSNDDWYCIYFEDESPEFQYVLAKTNDFITSTGVEAEEKVVITSDDVIKAFKEIVDDLAIGYEMINTPSDDMEYIEFSIPKDCENVEDWIGQMYVANNLSEYSTYCIELQDTDYGDGYLNFKFFYKGLKEVQ